MIETAEYIHQLNPASPDGAVVPVSMMDDHLRLIKAVLQATFPNVTGPLTATQEELNSLVDLLAQKEVLMAFVPEDYVGFEELSLGVRDLTDEDVARLQAITVTAEEINSLEDITGNVHNRLVALETETDEATFGGWTGGTYGRDNAGQFWTVGSADDAVSKSWPVVDVPENLVATLAIRANSVNASYQVLIDYLDEDMEVISSTTVVAVTEGNASVQKRVVERITKQAPIATAYARLRFAVSLGTIYVYEDTRVDVTLTAVLSGGTNSAGTSLVVWEDSAQQSGLVSSWTKVMERRIGAAGTVNTNLSAGGSWYSENFPVNAGDYLQVYVRKTSLEGWSEGRIYRNGTAVGTTRLGTTSDGWLPRWQIRTNPGTLIDGSF